MPAASINAQAARESVIQFAPRTVNHGDNQIAPQIFVPDTPAGGSNVLTEDDICMQAMDEFEDTG